MGSLKTLNKIATTKKIFTTIPVEMVCLKPYREMSFDIKVPLRA